MSDRCDPHPEDPPEDPVARLCAIMARLRDPEHGCPWDLEQDFRTIAPHTIEEAYEVADAIEHDDAAQLKDELGDLLFQVVFHAQLAAETGRFTFADVARRIGDKMVARHPHVFGDADGIDGVEAQGVAWEAHKAREREAAAARRGRSASALDGVARALPALSRASKLQRRAARVGFDWPGPEPVWAKLREELDELETELAGSGPARRLEDEFGDVLFALVNLGRHLSLDPESALRGANAKFERRFRHIEARLEERGADASEATLDDMERLWDEAKAAEDR